jgi:hypothetical protein
MWKKISLIAVVLIGIFSLLAYREYKELENKQQAQINKSQEEFLAYWEVDKVRECKLIKILTKPPTIVTDANRSKYNENTIRLQKKGNEVHLFHNGDEPLIAKKIDAQTEYDTAQNNIVYEYKINDVIVTLSKEHIFVRQPKSTDHIIRNFVNSKLYQCE